MTPEVWSAALEEAIIYEQMADDARRRALLACAQMHYEDAKPLRGGHPYLTALGLDMSGCEWLRVDREGLMCVPALDSAGDVASVLMLHDDGAEEWWPALSLLGTSYEIRRHDATVTVLCETFADGLVCFRALKTCRVLVLWTPQNMRMHPRPAGMVTVSMEAWAPWRFARINDRMGRRYNGRPTANEIERAVDAEIASSLMRAARFTGIASDGPHG